MKWYLPYLGLVLGLTMSCSGSENLKQPKSASLSCFADRDSCLNDPSSIYCDICKTTCPSDSEAYSQCAVYASCQESKTTDLCACTKAACMPGGVVCDQCEKHCGAPCVTPQ